MNHARGKVEEIYDRDDMVEGKRKAFATWANFVLSLLPGSTDVNASLDGEALGEPEPA